MTKEEKELDKLLFNDLDFVDSPEEERVRNSVPVKIISEEELQKRELAEFLEKKQTLTISSAFKDLDIDEENLWIDSKSSGKKKYKKKFDWEDYKALIYIGAVALLSLAWAKWFEIGPFVRRPKVFVFRGNDSYLRSSPGFTQAMPFKMTSVPTGARVVINDVDTLVDTPHLVPIPMRGRVKVVFLKKGYKPYTRWISPVFMMRTPKIHVQLAVQTDLSVEDDDPKTIQKNTDPKNKALQPFVKPKKKLVLPFKKKKVIVLPTKTIVPTPNPKKEKDPSLLAELSISCVPSHATIQLQKMKEFPCPLRAMKVVSGKYHIQLSADGFETKIKEMELKEGKNYHLDLELVPNTKRKTSKQKPRNKRKDSTPKRKINFLSLQKTQIFLGNRLLGTTPFTTQLREGKYSFRAQHNNWTETILSKITARTKRINIRFSKGTIKFYIRPWANVWVNGMNFGQTPIPPFQTIPGTYTIRLKKDSKEIVRKIKLLPKQNFRFVYNF